MSRPLHLTPSSSPGCGLKPDGRHLPCSGVTGGTAFFCYPSTVDRRFHSNVKSVAFNCSSVKAKFVCKARWNSDSPGQNKRGVPHNRNRQGRGGENFQNLEGDDMLSSKNGQLLSLSKTQRSQATAAPGPKEKDIIELFRKVQAQLRERAAGGEGKKSESSNKQGKDSGTVDSLLNVLRKHTVDESKSSHGSSKQKSKENSQHHGVATREFHDSESSVNDFPGEAKGYSARPLSKFQRRSPVPHVKYQPIPSIGDGYTPDSQPPAAGAKMRKNEDQTTLNCDDDGGLAAYPSLESDVEPGPEEPELVGNDVVSDGGKVNGLIQLEDLSRLKLQDLRGLAKSRGLKGCSKMKKNELVELLSRSWV